MAIQKTETSVNLRINQLNKKMFDDALAAGEISNTEMYVVEEADDPSSTALFDAAVYNDDVPPNIGEVDPTGLELILKQDFILQNLYNPNLLDNSNFADIVNQRNSASYSAAGYTIDRWLKDAAGTVNIHNGALNLTRTDAASQHYFYQRVSKDKVKEGESYTLSIMLSDNTVYTLSDVISSAPAIKNTPFGRITFVMLSSFLQILLDYSKSSINVKYMKLEKGNIATPYIPKGHGAELQECRRYYQPYKQTITLTWIGVDQIEIANFNFNPPMRTIPTLTASGVYGAIFFESASVTGVQISNRQQWNGGYNYCTGIIATADL